MYMVWNTKEEARKQIKDCLVDYYHQFMKKDEYTPGDRIQYGGTVFDDKELCSVADTLFEFWLGAGKFADSFEK